MEAGCWEQIHFVVSSKEGNEHVVRWVFIYHRVQAPGVHLHIHSNAISSKHHRQPHRLFDLNPFSLTKNAIAFADLDIHCGEPQQKLRNQTQQN